MGTTRRFRSLIIAVAAGVALTGCAANADAKTGPGQTVARYVDLPDGNQVLCVFWVPVDNTGVASAEGAQLSCDWEGIR